MLKKIAKKVKLFFIPCWENSYRARLLSSNFLSYYLLFLLVLKLVIVPVFVYLPKSAFFASLSKVVLIDLTNKQREALGLGSLKPDPLLDKAAMQKAKDMFKWDYFSHQSPQGKTPWYWFSQSDYQYQKAGENLAIGFLDAEEVFDAWYESPSHQANLVNPGYEDIGMAVLKGDFEGKETTVVVQLFGTKIQEPILAKEEVEEVKGETTIAPAPAEIEGDKEKIEEKEEIEKVEGQPATGTGQISQVKTQDRQVPASVKPAETDLQVGFFKFITINYLNIIQGVIFFSLILIILVLSFSVFSAIDIHPTDLLLKAVFFIFIFSLFIFLDKQAMLDIIPHTLKIY